MAGLAGEQEATVGQGFREPGPRRRLTRPRIRVGAAHEGVGAPARHHRALTGNGLSWAYTFEWPLFAGFTVVFWAKTIRDEFGIRRGGEDTASADAAAAEVDVLPAGLGTRQAEQPEDPEDEELARYNAYLARLNEEVNSTHGKRHGFR